MSDPSLNNQNPTNREIYLDNHATTRVDPRVVSAMVPWMTEDYANPGSSTHEPGRRAAAKISECRSRILGLLGADDYDLVFTSGATESVNLACLGLMLHPRQKRRRILVSTVEHRVVLDCASRLRKSGFTVDALSVIPNQGDTQAVIKHSVGSIELSVLEQSLTEDVALVSLIYGNNEIGSLQELPAIAERCHAVGAVLHIDATQAIGKIPFHAARLGADLVSFSAHKFYGPKGVGGLLIADRNIHLQPLIVGGGQQNNLRSGTLNSSGIVGMAQALELAIEDLPEESIRIAKLRSRLWSHLQKGIDGISLNGPVWQEHLPSNAPHLWSRLPGNLNVRFPKVEGQSLMLQVPGIAVSSGSACTSAEPHPSHVLSGIGLSDDQARCSLRFGIGRFNTEGEIDEAAAQLIAAYQELLHFVA